jgi:hypothetical protein
MIIRYLLLIGDRLDIGEERRALRGRNGTTGGAGAWVQIVALLTDSFSSFDCSCSSLALSLSANNNNQQ